jgi:hypothetical protein
MTNRRAVTALLRRSGLLLWVIVGLCQVATAAPGQGAEIGHYVEVFSGAPRIQQKQACQALQWAGLSDPRIFDLVENNLLAAYKQVDDRDDVDYAAWLSKALAFSGQDKYRGTLSEVAANGGHRNLRKHAAKALEELDNYRRWNPVLASRAGYATDQSDAANRLAAMLRSGEKGLQRAAAGRIHHGHLYDSYLLNTLEQAVQPALATDWSDKADIDAVAWMLRALAGAGKPEYRATLERAAASAGNGKVRKYAASYLKKYY